MSIERLKAGVIVQDNGCWIWQGAKRSGYGAIKYMGKVVATHRLSYELFKGEIRESMMICHQCDTPACINPDHLFVGSGSDNSTDAYSKGRVVVPIGVRYWNGQKAHNASITKEKAEEVKLKIAQKGGATLKSLSIDLGLPYQLLRDINRGRSYK